VGRGLGGKHWWPMRKNRWRRLMCHSGPC